MYNSLFEEHKTRFMREQTLGHDALFSINDALYNNDQVGWSLGLIPWRAWRKPFQSAMIAYLSRHYEKDAETIYNIVNNALATVHGDFLALPSLSDRSILLSTLQPFCTKENYERISKFILSILPTPPFLNSTFLEKILQKISKKRRLGKQENYAMALSALLHFRIINEFLKRCTTLIAHEDHATKNIIAQLTFLIFVNVDLEPPDFLAEKRLCHDSSKMSVEVYQFWSWQYTYRNSEYKKLIYPLEMFATGNIIPNSLIIAENFEYITILFNDSAQESILNLIFPEYNLAFSKILEKFDRYPAWPISDYTADFILRRMLSGEFRYWERETPLGQISEIPTWNQCSRNPKTCTNTNRSTRLIVENTQTKEICSPECLVAIKNKEIDVHLEIINKEIPRVRKEGIHRILGLWIWDYRQAQNASVADAIRALKKQHFPKDNPNWNPNNIQELQQKNSNLDWYDYCEQITEPATLYADYNNACQCIEAAKYLPFSRGKKTPKK